MRNKTIYLIRENQGNYEKSREREGKEKTENKERERNIKKEWRKAKKERER